MLRIYRKGFENEFKPVYVLAEENGSVITEGTSLEVLFVLLRMRDEMQLLERVQVNLMIYECFELYPDLIDEDHIFSSSRAATAAASGIAALT